MQLTFYKEIEHKKLYATFIILLQFVSVQIHVSYINKHNFNLDISLLTFRIQLSTFARFNSSTTLVSITQDIFIFEIISIVKESWR